MPQSREEMIADAQIRAAKAAKYAALLAQPAAERGCSMDECPGPRYSNGCPMGYAGSCQAIR